MLTDAERRALLAPPAAGAVLDVVFDTDATNEIDDEWAVVWALLAPERLRVLGLHACPYGYSADLVRSPALMADLDRRRMEVSFAAMGITADDVPTVPPSYGVARAAEELHRIVELTGVDVPVLDGATRYLPPDGSPVDSPAARHLVELAHADREGPLYVAAIGCATNVASALLIDPTIADRIVVLWTSAFPSFYPLPNASFNLAQDVPAARVLLDSGVPLVYLPGYYVGEELRTTLAEARAHVAGTGPLGDYLVGLYENHPLVPTEPGRSKVIWDMVVTAWLLDPSWLASRFVPTPHLDDDLRWRQDGDRHVMLEAYDVDRDAAFGDLFRRLAG